MDASAYPISASLDLYGSPPVLIAASSVSAARRAAETVDLAGSPLFRFRSIRPFPGWIGKPWQALVGSKWRRMLALRSIPRAASRARWLAELSAALDEAQTLLSQLVAQRIDEADADRLRARIDDLREELRLLHRRGFAPSRVVKSSCLIHPDWRPRRD